MICPCSVSRFRLLRRLCALFCAVFGCCAIPPARAQDLDKPVQTIDEEITAFAFAPDGRIVYSVRRPYKTKKFDLEHDDIWIQDSGGKRRRILQGEKFTRGDRPFTYAVDKFRWSPNGRIILAQLFTTTLLDDFGKTEDATATLVLEENGKEVKLGGTDSFINPGGNAEFLPDNLTIVYSTLVVKQPRPMYSFRFTNVATGPAGQCFEGRTFLDSDPIPRTNSAVAVERAVVLASQATVPVDVLPDSILQEGGVKIRRDESGALPADASLPEILADFERRKIIDALEAVNWSQTEAAEKLRIPLSTLNQKIKRLSVEIKRKGGAAG